MIPSALSQSAALNRFDPWSDTQRAIIRYVYGGGGVRGRASGSGAEKHQGEMALSLHSGFAGENPHGRYYCMRYD